MSKLEIDKLNFEDDDFEVVIEARNNYNNTSVNKNELIINRAQEQAQETITQARQEAKKIIEQAQEEVENKKSAIIEKANLDSKEIIEEAKKQAQDILEHANKEKDELLLNSQADIEKKGQESSRKGYDEGYEDAKAHFFDEIEEKLADFNKFCEIQSEIKDKILKNTSKDIINLISLISKKVILKEINGEILSQIVNKTIEYFEKKENITIILSQKYAKMLYEFQNKNLEDVADFKDFKDFKQYENFEVAYNNQIDEDTIIVENNKERFDSSIEQQLDVIINDIKEATNNNLELETYET